MIAAPSAASTAFAQALADNELVRSANAITPSSPSVSGILKLRGGARGSAPPSAMVAAARASLPLVHEDVATDDPEADAEWAKEMLAAATRLAVNPITIDPAAIAHGVTGATAGASGSSGGGPPSAWSSS